MIFTDEQAQAFENAVVQAQVAMVNHLLGHKAFRSDPKVLLPVLVKVGQKVGWDTTAKMARLAQGPTGELASWLNAEMHGRKA